MHISIVVTHLDTTPYKRVELRSLQKNMAQADELKSFQPHISWHEAGRPSPRNKHFDSESSIFVRN